MKTLKRYNTGRKRSPLATGRLSLFWLDWVVLFGRDQSKPKRSKMKWWIIQHVGVNATKKRIGIRLRKSPLTVLSVFYNGKIKIDRFED